MVRAQYQLGGVVQGPVAPGIDVILADQHGTIRDGVKTLLTDEGIRVVAEAADGFEVIRLVQSFHPSVVVLDSQVPGLRRVQPGRMRWFGIPKSCVVLTGLNWEYPYVFDALSSGVNGYVRRQKIATRLVPAIRDVARGRIHLCPDVIGPVMRYWITDIDSRSRLLQPTQRRVAQLIAAGWSIDDIAVDLDLSREVVEGYQQGILRAIARSLRG